MTLSEYVYYYREDRTHLGLSKETQRQSSFSKIMVASFLMRVGRSAPPLRSSCLTTEQAELCFLGQPLYVEKAAVIGIGKKLLMKS